VHALPQKATFAISPEKSLRTLQIICLAFRGGVECAGPSDLAEALCEISAAEIEFSK